MIKKNSAELERIKEMLGKDRMICTDDFTELVLKDLQALFSEYFCLKTTPKMVVEKENGDYLVSVCFIADAIKNFGVLPR